MPDPSLAMELTHVEKRYGRSVHALKGVSLNVKRGEIFGLLGPNGAGKSTLVKILMTVVRPTRAEGWVLGERVATKGALRQVGYLPENHRFPKYLTGRQTLDFFASLSGSRRSTRKRRIDELLDIVGMSNWADMKVGQYSKGMLQRVGIAQALAADPDLVFLDEPTDGVDPVGRRDIRDLLLRLRSEGRTIFINSHLLSELEVTCDRVAIMVGGTVAQQGSMQDLAGSRRWYEIEVEGSSGYDVGLLLGASMQPVVAVPRGRGRQVIPVLPSSVERADGVGTLPDGRMVESAGGVLRIGEREPGPMHPLVGQILRDGRVLRRLAPMQPSLEDLFLEAVEVVQGGAASQAGARIG